MPPTTSRCISRGSTCSSSSFSAGCAPPRPASLFGLPSLRIKGYYLAVATLAAQFFFDWLFIRIPWFTGYAPSGSVSAPPLALFGLKFDSPAGSYLFCLALLC